MANNLPKGAWWMRMIAAEGGQATAKRRLENTDPVTRSRVAYEAVRKRWGHPPLTEEQREWWTDGYTAGLRVALKWPARTRKKIMASLDKDTSAPDEDSKR